MLEESHASRVRRTTVKVLDYDGFAMSTTPSSPCGSHRESHRLYVSPPVAEYKNGIFGIFLERLIDLKEVPSCMEARVIGEDELRHPKIMGHYRKKWKRGPNRAHRDARRLRGCLAGETMVPTIVKASAVEERISLPVASTTLPFVVVPP
jgi:hypothetical protein